MRLRLLFVAAVTVVMLLAFSGKAWSCSNSCPKGMNCIQVCMPDWW